MSQSSRLDAATLDGLIRASERFGRTMLRFTTRHTRLKPSSYSPVSGASTATPQSPPSDKKTSMDMRGLRCSSMRRMLGGLQRAQLP
jgi:hypothetical protein